MLINCNKLEFFPGSQDWIDVCYNNEYIECLRPVSKNKIFLTYCVADKLLDMRNCDVIYLQNLYSNGGEWRFKQLETKLNRKLKAFRGL